MITEIDNEVSHVKVPPNSIQAEQSVLGSLMMDNRTWDSVADQLIERDFYRRNHQLIFRVIEQLAEQQMPLDIITLADKLKQLGELDNIGGIAYLILLVEDTPTAANIVAYAKIVKDKAVLRELIAAGTDIAESAFNSKSESAELIEYAERRIFCLAEQRQKQQMGVIGIKQLLKHTVSKIENLFEQEGQLTGLSTGFTEFDLLTSGLQPADLIIIAGRPSSGKTSIAMNIAENAALANPQLPILVFSLEMPNDAITTRMLSSIGGINQLNVRSGKLNDDDWTHLYNAIQQLSHTALFIDDTAALTPTELRARARRVAREQGQLGLIVIDYLQLMQSPTHGDNRVQEIADISRGLKALAKELNVPVVALSQLNRNLEQRQNKRPVMSDLRDSGSIEQDADLIAFVYRDEVYNPDTPDKGLAELIIGKQRNGPLGTVRLKFTHEFTQFSNIAQNSPVSQEMEE